MKLPALATALGLACSIAAPPAHADDAAMLRCRALTDAGARLACYDAMPTGAATAAGQRGAGLDRHR